MAALPIKKVLKEPHEKYLAFCRHSLKVCSESTNQVCNKDCQCTRNCKIDKFCLQCLSKIFEDDNSRFRRYKCENITYSYVLRYLNRYASEIFLSLKSNFIFDKPTPLDIVSIGCGPATELFGFERSIHAINPHHPFRFFGYEPNKLWNNCQSFVSNIFNPIPNCSVSFSNNFFDENNPLVPNLDFLVLNYLLSDIHKHSPGGISERDNAIISYLNSIILPIFKKMKKGSCILINDTNSYNMGRNAIEKWVHSINSLCMRVVKRYFDYPNRYPRAHFNSGDKQEKCNSLQFAPPNSIMYNYDIYTIHINECRSSYVLIQRG